jgi:hypothetical protein
MKNILFIVDLFFLWWDLFNLFHARANIELCAKDLLVG